MQLPPRILILERQMIVAADLSLQLLKIGYDVIGFLYHTEEVWNVIDYDRPDIIMPLLPSLLPLG